MLGSVRVFVYVCVRALLLINSKLRNLCQIWSVLLVLGSLKLWGRPY